MADAKPARRARTPDRLSPAGAAAPALLAVAHRGASRDFPENTVAAFDAALTQGCDGIELDVQLSRDGVPVVWHDRTLGRAGGGRRRVADVTVEDLRELRVRPAAPSTAAARPIPTLEQVLRRYAGRTRLLVEIKQRERADGPSREALVRAVAAAVHGRDAAASVSILCFDPRVLEDLRSIAPRLPRVLNLRPPRRLDRALRERLPALDAVCADVTALTPEFGAGLREAGKPLFVYTCNTERRVAAALRAGAAAILSDRPGWLAATLRDRGLR